jgi:ribonucleoside-diphosphate reductase alpha chain
MSIAMFLAQNETTKESLRTLKILTKDNSIEETEDKKEIRTYWAIYFYELISTLKVMLATPTLSNARTPRHQLSSCYVTSIPDNIEGIFDGYKEMALLSKFGGGIGTDWTQVRGLGGYIDNHKNAAGGIIPFLKITNDIAIAVDQLGTRKGAIAVYAEPWHSDINDFLDLKKNAGEERRRTHDLFPALWLNDLFMKRVEEDSSWTLFNPEETPELANLYGKEFEKRYIELENSPEIEFKEKVSAKNLWKKILLQYFETGTPFLCHKDTSNKSNPNKHKGIIRSSNLCTEIFQNTEPNKYKVSVEFTNGEKTMFNENDKVVTDEEIEKPAKKLSSLDSLNGKQVSFVEKIPELGSTAVCNLGSVNLSKVNTKEEIEKVVPILIRMLDNVIDLNFYPTKKALKTNLSTRSIGLGVMGEAQMLAESGIAWGSQEHFYKIDEIMEMISYNSIYASSLFGEEKGSYSLFEGSEWSKGIFPIDHANKNAKNLTEGRTLVYNWNILRDRVKEKGIRNGYLMAIAPTSSISILSGTSQAIEPIYKRRWFEENLSGLIPVVAPGLTAENWQLYQTAYETDQLDIIKAASIRQKWIDQGQSVNIFMKLENSSGKYLNEIYMTAWKYGLKSNYYLRSESPKEKEDSVADRSLECLSCQ